MRIILIILLVYTEASLENTYHWKFPLIDWGIGSLIVIGIILCLAQDITEVIKNLRSD